MWFLSALLLPACTDEPPAPEPVAPVTIHVDIADMAVRDVAGYLAELSGLQLIVSEDAVELVSLSTDPIAVEAAKARLREAIVAKGYRVESTDTFLLVVRVRGIAPQALCLNPEGACPRQPPPSTRAATEATGLSCAQEGTHWTAARADLDALLSDPDTLSRAGRLLPHRGLDGEMDGYRISAIRRASVLDSCGLRNGDVVQRFNGHAFVDLTGPLAAYDSLQGSETITIAGERRGAPFSVEIRVIP